MRVYQINNKPVIHYTDLANWLICPRLSQLARQYTIEPNDAMKQGLILERMVLGDKDNILDKLLERRKPQTIQDYELIANYIKSQINPIAVFHRIEIERDNYFLTGEIDFIENEYLCDLKITKQIKTWTEKKTFTELLQGYYYPYLYFLKYHEYKKFYYLVYSFDTNLTKKIIIEHPEAKFDEVERLIQNYINDPFYPIKPDACFKNGVCFYMNYCSEIKAELTEPIIIDDLQ